MPQLHIELQDGFTGQTVSIEVDGRSVYQRKGVTTDLRISRADALELQVGADHVTIAVSIDNGALRSTCQVDVLATPYLLIALAPPGQLRLTATSEMPLYM